LARFNYTCCVTVAVASFAALSASTALAGAFDDRLQSTIGTGLSFAGSGTNAYGLSGMYWNPAAINTATGWDWSSNYTFVAPYAQMHTTSASSPFLAGSRNSGNVGHDAFIPGSFGAYRINQDWVIGLAVTEPFGLTTKPERQWQGQGLAWTSKAVVVNTDLIVGYRVNDWLSLAAGPSIVYAKARFSRDVDPTSSLINGGTLRDLDDWGVGFAVGATIKPWQGGEIAIGYRSPVRLNLGGTIDVSPAPGLSLSAPVEGKITLPDMLTVGLSQELSPQWTALASVEWKNWSRVQTVPFNTRGPTPLGPTPATLDFNYRDGWNMALGAEYRWDEALTLRGGVGYEISPIDDQNRSPSIPDGDRIWLSGGASYAFSQHFSVDLAYGHGFVKSGTIKQTIPSTPLTVVAKSKTRIDIVSVGFRYKFGSDAVQKMPEAVVKP
jgi:long-chain fatty acid transport protein